MKKYSLIIVATVLATLATSQAATIYNTLDINGDGSNGDVWIGFSGSGVNNYTYQLDLGPISAFLSVSPGQTLTVFGVNKTALNSDLTTFYGTSAWYTQSGNTLGLFGGLTGTGSLGSVANNTFFIGYTNSTALGTIANPSNLSGSENTINTAGASQYANGYNNGGTVVANANIALTGNAIATLNSDITNPGWGASQFGGTPNTYNGNAGLAYRSWAFSMAGPLASTFYVNKEIGTTNNSIAGTFTVGSDATLTFTAANAVPEPATLPLVLVAVGAIFLVIRKKLKSIV
jgi:hypothetical protein